LFGGGVGRTEIGEHRLNAGLAWRDPVGQSSVAGDRQHHIHDVVRQVPAVEGDEVERRFAAQVVGEHDRAEPLGDLFAVFTRVRRRSGQRADPLGEGRQMWTDLGHILRGTDAIVGFTHLVLRNEQIGDQRQTPSRDLHLRGVTVERSRRPAMHPTLTDQMAGDLEDDRRDIAVGEEVLAALSGLRGEAVLLGQGREEGAERFGVSGKEVRGQPGKDRDILGPHDAARLSRR
jgi:hypothetical protein